ncbi:hypothetical protein CDL15_Pgr000328 [Punica granatum]|uniref:Secreted protein n=1 Tax=Punica granatum TaxID=22663 RepID=A0A218XTP0_PUNGR|nr:hypothetical protein CDL15_Pgr000328 [Punica granatum]
MPVWMPSEIVWLFLALLALDDLGSSYVVCPYHMPSPADLRMNNDILLCGVFFCDNAQVMALFAIDGHCLTCGPKWGADNLNP